MQDKITAKIEFRFFKDQRNVLSNILQNFFSIVIVILYPVIIYIKF